MRFNIYMEDKYNFVYKLFIRGVFIFLHLFNYSIKSETKDQMFE